MAVKRADWVLEFRAKRIRAELKALKEKQRKAGEQQAQA